MLLGQNYRVPENSKKRNKTRQVSSCVMSNLMIEGKLEEIYVMRRVLVLIKAYRRIFWSLSRTLKILIPSVSVHRERDVVQLKASCRQ